MSASRKSLKNHMPNKCAIFARKPHDPDSADEEEEEGESEAGDGKEGEVEMENVVEGSDQVFADLRREDHVEAGRSLPPEGKAGPSPQGCWEGRRKRSAGCS